MRRRRKSNRRRAWCFAIIYTMLLVSRYIATCTFDPIVPSFDAAIFSQRNNAASLLSSCRKCEILSSLSIRIKRRVTLATFCPLGDEVITGCFMPPPSRQNHRLTPAILSFTPAATKNEILHLPVARCANSANFSSFQQYFSYSGTKEQFLLSASLKICPPSLKI